METIISKIDGSVLHIIHRFDDTIEGRENICSDDQFIQLATLKLKKGTTFKAHKHIIKEGNKEIIAQESWVVLKGSVKAFLYDKDDTLLCTKILKFGDCSITFFGGHNYEIIDHDTIVYEYKTGPYHGVEMDKVFI